MPREDRRIIFELHEVYKAIYSLCVQKQLKGPPPGELKRVEQDAGDPARIFLTSTIFKIKAMPKSNTAGIF